MTCPTCDHTMAMIGRQEEICVFHCARCGTVKTMHAAGTFDIYVPTLVERCRSFDTTAQNSLFGGNLDNLVCEWDQSGIHEAIQRREASK